MSVNRHRTGAFLLRIAATNLRRNRRTYLPYYAAASVMACVYLLICGLTFSKTIQNLPSGNTATVIFVFGIVVFSVFTFFFLIYINGYLVSQRKREFGLYGVLGLEKRHVGRVLLIEGGIVLFCGFATGAVFALVFGRLVFFILMKLIDCVPGSTFALAPKAFAVTAVLFALVFTATSLLNLRQIRLSSPIELLRSQNRGEKETHPRAYMAIIGFILLGAAYYFAWTTSLSGEALMLFFPLTLLVILATHILSVSGSDAVLQALHKNKRYYYRPVHFVTVSGLIQRMRQNARGLATICVVSTMLVVTVSGTLSLYLGQEGMLAAAYPYDVAFSPYDDLSDQDVRAFEGTILALAEEHHVALSADPSKITRTLAPNTYAQNNYMPEGARQVALDTLLYFDGEYRFDADGKTEDCAAFIADLGTAYEATQGGESGYFISDVFSARADYYGLYGGLLFLGVFFGLLFLAVAALIIYFKQVTEGCEDRARFETLRSVGMDEALVKKTIRRQVLWVFFIPLGMTAVHMVFASKIMINMFQSFNLFDWKLELFCIAGTLAVFTLIYFVVYKLTARVYLKIIGL